MTTIARPFAARALPGAFPGALLRPLARSIAVVGALVVSPAVHAHEFWIEPHDFTPEAGAPLVADLHTGQYLTAEASPWDPGRFESFRFVDAEGERDVTGERGAIPAIELPTRGTGVQVFAAESNPQSVRYPNFEKFRSFVTEEGAPEIAERHLAAGLPTANLIELYTRHAKALVSVHGTTDAGAGDAGIPVDTPLGLELELVALDDPYGPDVTVGTELRFQLMYEGAPLPDTQVALFHRKGGAGAPLAASTKASDNTAVGTGTPEGIERTVARTDPDGRVAFPVAGDGIHLVSAVLLRRPSARAMLSSGAMWESLWASLTFAPDAVSGTAPGARPTP